MSILIKGMEMPQPKFADMATFYDAYILVNPNGRAVIVVDDEDGLNSIEYTLVPVPPHGRLIDADALIIALETQDYSCAPDTLEEWTPMDMTKVEIADIRNAPTIIPAEEGEA